jgi:hypothetical protein
VHQPSHVYPPREVTKMVKSGYEYICSINSQN